MKQKYFYGQTDDDEFKEITIPRIRMLEAEDGVSLLLLMPFKKYSILASITRGRGYPFMERHGRNQEGRRVAKVGGGDDRCRVAIKLLQERELLIESTVTRARSRSSWLAYWRRRKRRRTLRWAIDIINSKKNPFQLRFAPRAGWRSKLEMAAFEKGEKKKPNQSSDEVILYKIGTSLSPFMQSLNLNQETCKTQNIFIKNEIFKSSKISYHGAEDAAESGNSLGCFERTDPTDYGPIHEHLPKVESPPRQTSQISSKDSSEGFKNSLKSEGAPEKCQSSIKINLINSSIMKKDVLKDSPPNGEETRTLKCFFRSKKVGEIVSTSRTGHLIERKAENCFVVSGKADGDEGEGCDSNDNIIVELEKSRSEMHDINDNPSEKLAYQKEDEANLSDNTRSANSDSEAPCGIGLLERLIRSHPVWFLPGIQRAGAVHLLQGKEEGNFIVRQSSQPDTMAVSVRLPIGKGPYIEHYLIQAVDGQLSLESSENMFESIPSLIAHYCQCCDELPVQLTLPRTIREARNRQQLSSLALLGQEFWRYPMANPRPPESRNSSPSSNKSDSLSSFDGVKKLVKQNNEIVLDLVPLHRDSQPSSLSTFKSSPGDGGGSSLPEENKPKRPHTLDLICTNTVSEKTGLPPGPKTPPQPPPRWTKPTSLAMKQFTSITASVTMVSPTSKTNQTTIIEEERTEFGDRPPFTSSTYPTTNPSTPVTHYDCNVSSPQSDQTNLRSFAFDRDVSSLKHLQEARRPQLISPVSDNTCLVSKGFEKVHITPSPASTPTERVEHIFKKYKKDTKHKESAHYQECDILESPTLHYYKSNVADKQSDYEDIWATESFTTFKPSTPQTAEPETRRHQEKPEMKKPPDLLEKLDKQFRLKLERSFPPGDNCDTEEQDADGAQNSPFYAEPADALVVRRKTRMSFNKSRHSDPFSCNNWSPNTNPYFSGGNVLDRIDSQNEVSEDTAWKGKPSLSFDNIINLKKKEGEGKPKVAVRCKNVAKAKPVRPPKVDSAATEKSHQNWTVDSSWEFIGNDENEKEGERRFPSLEQQMDSEEAAACKYTVQEIITQRFPQFKISRGFGAPSNKSSSYKENAGFSYQLSFPKSDNKSESRISAYDNLTCDRANFFKPGSDFERSEANCDSYAGPCPNYEDCKLNETSSAKIPVSSDTLRFRRRVECGSVTEDNEDTQTIFSEPWDSSRWENLLPTNNVSSEESCFEGHGPTDPRTENGEEVARVSEKGQRRFEKCKFASMPPAGLKSKEVSTMGASIRSYALHLASDKSTTFAQNIDNFIDCTLESKETNPQVVMRNMRQFMSGMKNYLVKHGEREFEKQVEKERMKLKSTEFLNLDAILEGVMHKLVVRPLREHLYKLFVDEYIKSGAIQLLYDNLIYARTKSLHDLGLRAKITPPGQEALEALCHYILKLQEVDSPLEKLDHLLACVSTIIHSVKSSNHEKPNIALGADDILPLFVWVLVHSGFIAAEIESEYMWGLLHPSLLSGEGCYYLTTLSSAVHVLKNLKSCDLEQANRLAPEWDCGEMKSVLKIIVPDELHGSILTKTLPVKPNMTTKDVCKIIAHKIRITNPQDYGLFRLVDGEETLLNDNECPQDIKSQLLKSGKHCTLAYKRIDAKIGWPRTT